MTGGLAKEAVRNILERLSAAAEKSRRESEVHHSYERGVYAEGTTHGLREAARMLREALARNAISPEPSSRTGIDTLDDAERRFQAFRRVVATAVGCQTDEHDDVLDAVTSWVESAKKYEALTTRLRAELAEVNRRHRLCVAAVVTDPSDRLLLVRHRQRGWELPGGKVEPGETWRDALRRELREETGLDVQIAEENPRVLDGKPVNGAPYASLIVVACARAVGAPMVADPDGHTAEARWFTRAEVPFGELSQLTSAEMVREWVREAGL